MTSGAPDRVAVGVASDTGRLRDHNEDSYLVRPPLYAVADGMGGHAAGEVASRLAIESVDGAGLHGDSGPKAIRQALGQANRVVYQQASGEGPSRGMGTTCVILLLADGLAHIGHVGDSRIYLLRAESLTQLTRDHTVVADMVEQGLMTDEQAMTDNSRGYLTRALGGAASVEPDVRTVTIEKRDRFLLCSDGLTTMVADDQIRTILESEADPQAAADALVAAANEAGGEDNVTAVVVDPSGSAAASLPARRSARLIPALLLALALAGAILALLLFGGPLGAPPASPTIPAPPVQSVPVTSPTGPGPSPTVGPPTIRPTSQPLPPRTSPSP